MIISYLENSNSLLGTWDDISLKIEAEKIMINFIVHNFLTKWTKVDIFLVIGKNKVYKWTQTTFMTYYISVKYIFLLIV